MEKLLKLLLLTAFFNGLAWIILIPLWQYPDEQAHFAQVQDISELGHVPTGGFDTSYEISLSEKILGTERDGFGNNKYTYHPEYNIEYSDNLTGLFEAEISNLPKSARTDLVKDEATHNPPLYYFLDSFFYKAFYNGDLFTRVYAVRFMSVLLFLISIFATYKISKLIFENRMLQIALPALIAFKPMLNFASTGILPDSLTNLLFTVLLFVSMLILKNGTKISYLIFALSLIILGSLTRQQFLISLPIIFTALIFRIFTNRSQLRKHIKPTLLFISTILFLGYIFAPFEYLKSLSFPETGRPDISLLVKQEFIDHIKLTLNQGAAQTLPWYWGVYRWLSLTVPPITYQIINRLIAVAIVGLLIRFFIAVKKRKFLFEDIAILFMIIASVMYFLIIAVWDYYFRLDHKFSFGIQGRYFFPLAVAHLSILTIGLWQVFKSVLKKYAKFAIIFIVFLMIIFNDISLVFISSSYYDTSPVNTFINQASQYKPELFKGNFIIIILLTFFILQAVFLLELVKSTLKLHEA